MAHSLDPRQVLCANTLARIVPRPLTIEGRAPVETAEFDAWVGSLHPGVALLFRQAVGELAVAQSGALRPADSRSRVRVGLYVGYSHGRACLGANGPSGGLFRGMPEQVASCLDATIVRLDLVLLRGLLGIRSVPRSAHGTPQGVTPTALNYGLAMALVECDMLETR